jgi:hypothetical protein
MGLIPPPPPPSEVVAEVRQSAEDTADATEDVVDAVLNEAGDAATGGTEGAQTAVENGVSDAGQIKDETSRAVAEIIRVAQSVIDERRADAQRLGADFEDVVLVLVAVVLIVIAIVTAVFTFGAGVGAIASLVALAGNLVGRAAKADKGASADAGAKGAISDAVLLRVKSSLQELRRRPHSARARLFVVKEILRAVHELKNRSRSKPSATKKAGAIPLPAATLDRCLMKLQTRMRMRGASHVSLSALHGLIGVRSTLAASAQAFKPPLVVAKAAPASRPTGLANSTAFKPR